MRDHSSACVFAPGMATRNLGLVPRRFVVLAICCMSLFIVGLDVTVVNVALPTIRHELHASIAQLQWVIDAYTLVLASLLMLAGSTADRLGRARIFQIGLALFSAGSLLCSVAPTAGLLIAFRALQAVGGSMLNPVAMSIIRNTFENPRERAQAIGIWGAVIGLSMALGPVLGGALVDGIGWRAIFWVNVPVGLLAIFLTRRFVPESRADEPRRPDVIGQVLVFVMLASVTYAIIEAPDAGWLSAQTLGTFALGALALLGVLVYEPRRDQPLIELRFFRSAPFAGATLIAIGAFVNLAGFLFLNTLYLQHERGLSPLEAGLATLPMAVMTIVGSTLSGRMVARRGPRLPLAIAGTAFVAACATLTGLASDTPLPALLAVYVVFGIGFGFVNAPITNTAVSGMPRAQAGVAAAVATTSRQVGQTLGVAVVGAIATGTAWWVLTACGATVLILGLAATGPRAGRSARRTAAALNPEALAA